MSKSIPLRSPRYGLKKAGFRARINDMCRDCIYDRGTPGTWRLHVENCSSPKCPIYDIRPRVGVRKRIRMNFISPRSPEAQSWIRVQLMRPEVFINEH